MSILLSENQQLLAPLIRREAVTVGGIEGGPIYVNGTTGVNGNPGTAAMPVQTFGGAGGALSLLPPSGGLQSPGGTIICTGTIQETNPAVFTAIDGLTILGFGNCTWTECTGRTNSAAVTGIIRLGNNTVRLTFAALPTGWATNDCVTLAGFGQTGDNRINGPGRITGTTATTADVLITASPDGGEQPFTGGALGRAWIASFVFLQSTNVTIDGVSWNNNAANASVGVCVDYGATPFLQFGSNYLVTRGTMINSWFGAIGYQADASIIPHGSGFVLEANKLYTSNFFGSGNPSATGSNGVNGPSRIYTGNVADMTLQGNVETTILVAPLYSGIIHHNFPTVRGGGQVQESAGVLATGNVFPQTALTGQALPSRLFNATGIGGDAARITFQRNSWLGEDADGTVDADSGGFIVDEAPARFFGQSRLSTQADLVFRAPASREATIVPGDILRMGPLLVEGLAFANRSIYVQPGSGISGFADALNGSSAQPLDNFADAISLATTRGFVRIVVLPGVGSLTLATDCPGFTIAGDSTDGESPAVIVSVTGGTDTSNGSFINLILDGDLTGGSGESIVGCLLGPPGLDASSNVTFRACQFGDATFNFIGGGSARFLNCFSAVAGVGTPIHIYSGIYQAEYRGWIGGADVRGLALTSALSVDLVSGHCILDTTVDLTNMSAVIRGVGKFTNNATSPDSIDRDGFLDRDIGSEGVYIDPQNGSATASGRFDDPVDTIATARPIADTRGVRRYYLSGTTFEALTESHENWEFIGRGSGFSVNLGSQSIANSLFTGASITGTQIFPSTNATFLQCDLTNVTNLSGTLVQCAVGGLFDGSNTGSLTLEDCRSVLATFESPAGITRTMQLVGHSGNVTFQNLDAASVILVTMASGTVTLDASVTAGTSVIQGVGTFVDNSGGTHTVTSDGFLDVERLRAEVGEARRDIDDDNPAQWQEVLYHLDGSEWVRLNLQDLDGAAITSTHNPRPPPDGDLTVIARRVPI